MTVRSSSGAASNVKFGYIYDSAVEGTLGLQRIALKTAGVERQIEERWNRSDASRPALAAAVSALAPGDTLVSWKLDSLASTLPGIVTVLYRLKERGISYLCAADGTTIGVDSDARTSWLIDALYNSTRVQIHAVSDEQTRSPPRGRIRSNKKGRRMSLSEADVATACDLIYQGSSVTSVAKLLNVGRSTLYRSIRANIISE